jgi:hypothetical protein
MSKTSPRHRKAGTLRRCGTWLREAASGLSFRWELQEGLRDGRLKPWHVRTVQILFAVAALLWLVILVVMPIVT